MMGISFQRAVICVLKVGGCSPKSAQKASLLPPPAAFERLSGHRRNREAISAPQKYVLQTYSRVLERAVMAFCRPCTCEQCRGRRGHIWEGSSGRRREPDICSSSGTCQRWISWMCEQTPTTKRKNGSDGTPAPS